MTQPNLLISLFPWRPREGKSSEENFLTEAFAYTLRTQPALAQAFVERLLGSPGTLDECHVETRSSYEDDSSTIYPDMEITGTFSGEPFRLFVENKWNSPFNPSQMTRYGRLLTAKGDRLAFVCARQRDYKDAKAFAADATPFRCYLWADVFALLREVPEPRGMIPELMEFMRVHGLSPGVPISPDMIAAYVSSRGFQGRLSRLCEKLANEPDWSFVPEEYRSSLPYPVQNRYGRIALEMDPGHWVGAVTIGFLYDSEKDHRVAPVDAKSIDFFLRIEASPSNDARRRSLVDALRVRLPAVRQAGGLAHVDGDLQSRNDHTLFIAHQSLAQLIAGAATEEDQMEVLFAQAKSWIEAIFSDGTVSQAASAYRAGIRGRGRVAS